MVLKGNVKDNYWEKDVPETEVKKKIITRKYKGVEVIIIDNDGLYAWESTNYGTKEERANAIDHFHKIYHFENWE